MTDGDLQVTLTEDEVMAVASSLGQPWPTPFALRNPVDVDGTRRAVERGALSLTIRRLATAGGSGLAFVGDLRTITDAFSRHHHVAVYRGHPDRPEEARVPTVYLHTDRHDSALVEVESGVGARVFALMDKAEVFRRIVATARAVFDGPSAADGLHVAEIHGGRATTISVGAGRMTSHALSDTGSEQTGHTLFWDESRLTSLLDLTPATS